MSRRNSRMWMHRIVPAILTGASSLSMAYSPITNATQSVAYTGATPSTSGGKSPYTYSISSGTLPSGFTLDTSTGVISGTDSSTETKTGIVLRVTDSASTAIDSSPFTITVSASASLTVNISFDASWAVQPSGLPSTSGTLSYPAVGFVDQPTMDAFTAVVNQWVADFKQLTNSTATINLNFGCGRMQLVFTSDFVPVASVPAANSKLGTILSLAQYTSLVNSMTNATQKSCWFIPGSLAVNPYVTTPMQAMIQNSVDAHTVYIGICANGASAITGHSWDTDPDTTTCDPNKVKLYRILWHEISQGLGRSDQVINIDDGFPDFSMAYMLAFTAPNTLANQTSTGIYFSIDNGATSLGGITTTHEFDFTSGTGGFAFTTTLGSACIPASPMIIPGGNTLPLRAPEDAKLLCALYPPSAVCKTLAGL